MLLARRIGAQRPTTCILTNSKQHSSPGDVSCIIVHTQIKASLLVQLQIIDSARTALRSSPPELQSAAFETLTLGDIPL
eukprot:3804450-Pleurochrysis_carterae.AAC.2